MYSARVIAEGVRAVDPAATQGLYTPEEIQDLPPVKNITPEVEVDKPKADDLDKSPPKDKVQDKSPDVELKENQVRGVVEKIETHEGNTKGKEWKRYGIVLADGSKFGTFDEELKDVATDLQGEEVIITFESKGKFKNLVAIEPLFGDAHESDSTTN